VVPLLVSWLALVLFAASRTVRKDIEALHAWMTSELEPLPVINR